MAEMAEITAAIAALLEVTEPAMEEPIPATVVAVATGTPVDNPGGKIKPSQLALIFGPYYLNTMRTEKSFLISFFTVQVSGSYLAIQINDWVTEDLGLKVFETWRIMSVLSPWFAFVEV
jgi:hypothetical protein